MRWKLPVIMLSAAMIATTGYHWATHRIDKSSAEVVDPIAPAIALKEPPATPDSPFASFTYYSAECAERYVEYQLRMPELDTQTVIWHVNAGLDQAPYSLVTVTEGDHPLLVNKQHRLPDNYEPPELVEIHSNIMATPGTAEAFRRMRSAAMQEDVYIEAAGGYRSLEKQKELFEAEELYRGTQAAEEAVARPGFGEHSTGRALHIVDRNYTFTSFDETPEYCWLIENCADYGFILRYGEALSHITGFTGEPYHFTFVGRDIALAMKEMCIDTLEEYTARGLAPLQDTPIDDRIAVVIAPGYGSDTESTAANDLAVRIQGHLAAENVRVVIAQGGRGIENEAKAAALVGIDYKGADDGTVVLHHAGKEDSRSLAETVCTRLTWVGLNTEIHHSYTGNNIAPTGLNGAPAVLIEACGRQTDPDYSERLAKSISDAVSAHLGLRIMYLTFDDGPSTKNTPKVLDILSDMGVKATFFVVGEMAEANPELLQRIAADGHAIGIHCYNHDYYDLYSSVESFLDDFYRARKIVEDITGLAPVIYRFPGGSINHYNREVYTQIIEEMDKLGFVYFDWNISVDDAVKGVKTGDLIGNVQESTRHRYAVLLMHDAYPYIAEELEEIVRYYSDYQMNVIDDETLPVHL